MSNGLAYAVAGATRPAQQITWTDGDGDLVNLTGATITGVIYNPRTYQARAIAGTLSVTDGPNGIFTWSYSADDVVEGSYLVQFTAAFASGQTPSRSFEEKWVVYRALEDLIP